MRSIAFAAFTSLLAAAPAAWPICEHPPAKEGVARHWYTLAVEETLRGQARKTVRLKSENDSGRWLASIGERRVVFARQGRVSGLCSDVDAPGSVEKTRQEIRALARDRRATIEGEVIRGSGPGWPGEPGHPVLIAGRGEMQRIRTDADGRFSLTVAPGRYRIVNRELRATEYSLYPEDGFRLAAGQCAQLQLGLR